MRAIAWVLCALLMALGLAGPAKAQPDAGERQLLVMLQLPKAHFRPDGAYAGAYGTAVGRHARQRLAQELARAHGLELRSDWPMPLVGVDCFVLRLPPGDARSPAELAERVAQDPRVAWAQPVQLYQAQSAEQEPLYPAQPVAQRWKLAELHRLSTGRGVKVAVIDSGVEARHPDLDGQLAAVENFVDAQPTPAERHGTAVAGIIAARADNRQGIAGVAPGVRLLGLRACWQAADERTLCNSLSLAKALHAAVLDGAHIINLSLGGPPDRLLSALLDQAQARGIAVVAAQPQRPDAFPAGHPGVLVVGGAPPAPSGGVVAPGRDIPTTAPGGGWSLVTGSSFAAAHASGLLALLRERDRQAWRGGVARTLVTALGGQIDSCATLVRHLGARASCQAMGQTAD
jgi:subtilisin family serine protease